MTTGNGPIRPTRAEVDLDAIVSNARELAARVSAKILGVVKADAYGHGAVPVARALVERGGVFGLMVSLVEEGFELRRAGIGGPMIVMGGVYTGAHRDVLAHDLNPVVSEWSDVEAFARAAAAANTRARIHVKADTGMSRLGVRAEEIGPFLDRVLAQPAIELVGLCTHLASADDDDPTATKQQLARFDAALAVAKARGVRPEIVHAANSAGALRFPEAGYDAVRPGLVIYGGGEALGGPGHQAMRLVTAISRVAEVRAGESVSYGGLWVATRATRVATLPIGYADGYPRRLSSTIGRGEVLIRGRRCPVLGAVCMDMTIVDVSSLPADVGIGDEVVLLGAQGDDRISAAELASRAGLIEYEITCGVSKRVPRVVRQRAS